MSRRIPVTSSAPLYEQRTTLDGQDYIFTFYYNARDFSWYFDIADQDGEAISAGVRVVVDWDLLKRVVDARRPPGLLVANDLSGAGLDPGADDFGSRVELLYFEAAEVAEELASG
jgi:hypothetical protein